MHGSRSRGQPRPHSSHLCCCFCLCRYGCSRTTGTHLQATSSVHCLGPLRHVMEQRRFRRLHMRSSAACIEALHVTLASSLSRHLQHYSYGHMYGIVSNAEHNEVLDFFSLYRGFSKYTSFLHNHCVPSSISPPTSPASTILLSNLLFGEKMPGLLPRSLNVGPRIRGRRRNKTVEG
jgi:hypothetical protein